MKIQIEKHLELPHMETIVGTNTLQTKPFDNQKIENMSNNTTQTAVEWLVEKINKQKAWANPEQLEPLIQQAKEMEKEQIINSFGVGCQVESTRLIGYQAMAEQY